MPTIYRLSHALKICMYADDHAPPHFHVKRPGVAFQVRLADLEVMEGDFDRRDLDLAVAWAAENLELLAQKWRELNERD